MTEQKISIEAAENEWKNFLIENEATGLIPCEDLKNSSDKEDRDEYKSQKKNYDVAALAIAQGRLVITDNVPTIILKFPILDKEGNPFLSELEFSGRWQVKDRERVFKGLNQKDASDMLFAQRKLAAILTGQSEEILGRIDGKDASLVDIIVSVFFM